MKKIPKKYAPLLGTAIMSVLMAFMMSGIVTAINLNGFPTGYISLWMQAFSKVVFIAFGVILMVRPLVEKMVSKLTQ